MNRRTAHPCVLAEMLDDYLWCVEHGIFKDTPEEGWPGFVAGYVATEERMRRHAWRRPRQRRAA